MSRVCWLWIFGLGSLAACNERAVESNVDSPPATTSAPAAAPGAQAAEQPARSAAVNGGSSQEAPAAKSERVAQPAPLQDACPAMCRRSTELGCGDAQHCQALCSQALADGPCSEPMRTFLACALAEPSERWECTEDRVAALRDGYCEAEQAAFAACLQRAAP